MNYENNEESISSRINSSHGNVLDGWMRKYEKDDSASKTYNFGIDQFAEHGSLDNCRKGFLKGLESKVSKKERTERLNIKTHRQIQLQITDSHQIMYPRN